jgi:tryptophan-rich sensory protein
MINQLKIILTSFSHLLLTISYNILNINNLNKRPKVFLQPPDIVFSVVWTTFYLIFGISNLKILYDTKILNSKKIKIINQSITESILHWLWLVINSKFFTNNFCFKIISMIILICIVHHSFIRSYFLKKTDKFLHNLYIPYKLWIIFALFLEIQNLYNF